MTTNLNARNQRHAQLRIELQNQLLKIINCPTLHARWLNTFSLLEYIGFKKMVSSHSLSEIDLSILTHSLEEGRHATLFKKKAIHMGGAHYSSYRPATTLAGEEATNYFTLLERECVHEVTEFLGTQATTLATQTKITYLCLTKLIEERAVFIYTTYELALAQTGQPSSVAGLLAEEVHHLRSVTTELVSLGPDWLPHYAQLENYEESLFNVYFDTVSGLLAQVENQTNAQA
jgi:hypothetical protein